MALGMAQSWPWGSQIVVKKKSELSHPSLFHIVQECQESFIVCTPLSAGGRGVTFFMWGLQFYKKNKMKSEIFKDKKVFKKYFSLS